METSFVRRTSLYPRGGDRPSAGETVRLRVGYVGVLLGAGRHHLAGDGRRPDSSDIGELAQLGIATFQFLAPLQLVVTLFAAAMMGAGSVAAEKDRRTLDLLLMTQLSNVELVLGKLLASLVAILPMLVAAIPLFVLLTLLGGVTLGQIARVFAIVCASAIAAGSMGSTVAFWREKTFQSLAVSLLLLVAWLAFGEAIDAGLLGDCAGRNGAASWSAPSVPGGPRCGRCVRFRLKETTAIPFLLGLGPVSLCF